MKSLKALLLITMLLLALIALVVSCQNTTTKAETSDSTSGLRHLEMRDMFWFVESFNLNRERTASGRDYNYYGKWRHNIHFTLLVKSTRNDP